MTFCDVSSREIPEEEVADIFTQSCALEEALKTHEGLFEEYGSLKTMHVGARVMDDPRWAEISITEIIEYLREYPNFLYLISHRLRNSIDYSCIRLRFLIALTVVEHFIEDWDSIRAFSNDTFKPGENM